MVLSFNSRNTLPGLADCLRKGGVAVIPCDTIYGIVGRVPDTEERIRKIKGRGESNPFLQLAPCLESVDAVASEKVPGQLRSLWPGPVTMIMNDKEGSSRALRVPADDFLMKLMAELGFFIYSTSVNKSGSPHLDRIDDIIDTFEEEVDLIINRGDLTEGKASTLIDIRERPVKILRQGSAVIPPELLNLS